MSFAAGELYPEIRNIPAKPLTHLNTSLKIKREPLVYRLTQRSTLCACHTERLQFFFGEKVPVALSDKLHMANSASRCHEYPDGCAAVT